MVCLVIQNTSDAMIRNYVNGEWKDTEAIYAGGQTITAVYEGERLVWEAGRLLIVDLVRHHRI